MSAYYSAQGPEPPTSAAARRLTRSAQPWEANADGLRCPPPRLQSCWLHEKLHQTLNLDLMICKPSRSPPSLADCEPNHLTTRLDKPIVVYAAP
jgi:hypothetical protein